LHALQQTTSPRCPDAFDLLMLLIALRLRQFGRDSDSMRAAGAS
jgi:hypothetical protein